jgi:broad specificity phosphatase PhoE
MMASVLLAACLLAAVTRSAVSPAATVYIIRHGEKTWALGCLDDLGKARAASLPSVFNSKPSPSHATFQTPAALFANQVRHDKLGRANPSHRELELLLLRLQPLRLQPLRLQPLRLQPLRLQPKHQQQSVWAVAALAATWSF